VLSSIPIAGETISATSTVYENCTANSPILSSSFSWKYWTLSHYDTWGDYSDVWRTALHEYGDGTTNCGNVYNYIYARNKGAVHFWTIAPNCTTGNGSGIEFYATTIEAPQTPTTTPTKTPTPTQTPVPSTATITATPTPFSTAYCVLALDVYVCDKYPYQE